jgi:N utilization substance protein B
VTQARRLAREAALQALYAWEVGRTTPEAAIEAVLGAHYPAADAAARVRAAAIVRGTVSALADLDRLIGAHSQHWRLERLAVIDRLILRMAIWELQERDPAPRAVVVHEALELARRFSGEDSVKFINGVLDAVGRALEAGERPAGDPPTQHGE